MVAPSNKVDQVPKTSWSNLLKLDGPLIVTQKENGCIIFMSHLNGNLIITSKHALNNPHTMKATEWLQFHLNRANRTQKDLVSFLEKHNVTAVFELADDDFEEHILEYPAGSRGLYVHGLNVNSLDFHTLGFSFVREFGEMFGFHQVNYFTLNTMIGPAA
jgi:tRNA ligase